MSTLHVLVARIDNVSTHPKLDRLDVIEILGNTTVAEKGKYKPGDLALYIPGDAVLPRSLAESWGVTKYLQDQKDGTYRVRPVHDFRGVKASGMIQDPGIWQPGVNIAPILGITKYVYPEIHQGQESSGPEWFHKYTDIENLNNYREELREGETVYITEKVHGTNSRIGYDGTEFFVGSRSRVLVPGSDFYSDPLPKVADLLKSLATSGRRVIAFGEIYGPKVQKGFSYGVTGRSGYKVFDISVDGRYLEPDVLDDVLCNTGLRLPSGKVEYTKDLRIAGPSILHEGTILEGLVVRPVVSRRYWKKTGNLSRAIFKVINPQYKNRNGGTEFQ